MIPISSDASPLVDFTYLENQFKSAWRFLNQTTAKQKKLSKLPWYLVIGPTESGKSTLITQANLSLIEAKTLATPPHEETLQSKRCNWWFSTEGTLVDIPGNYLVTSEKNIERWEKFCRHLKSFTRKKSFSGVILTIDLNSLASDKTNDQHLIEHLKQTLHTLSKSLKHPCPIYLFLTKADGISGFKEFFSDSGKEERSEIWGINFLPARHHTNLTAEFNNCFDQLIARLNHRIIWRLHQERNPEKRILIQNFPQQLEVIRSQLSALVHIFSDMTQKNPLDGIYFTSSIQNETSTDFLHNNLNQVLQLSPTEKKPSFLFGQSYNFFSQHLFKKIFTAKKIKSSDKKYFDLADKQHWLIYTGIGSIILIASVLMTQNFIHNVARIDAAEKALTKYSLLKSQLSSTNPDLSQVLPILNQLQQSSVLLQQIHLPWIFAELLHQKSSSLIAQNIYHHALAASFLPCLGNLLQQPLNETKSPIALYSTLKIYLMLGDPDHFNAEFVTAWFHDYWKQINLNPVLRKQLETHLQALIAKPFAPLNLNQQTIAQARNTLSSASDSILVYAILKNNIPQQSTAVLSADQIAAFNKIFISDNKNLTIPHFYTAKIFPVIYFQDINNAVNTALNGDWVLGNNLVGLKKQQIENSQNLVQAVQTLYLMDYSQRWENFINQIHVIPWQNWQQGISSLNNLLEKNSPLITIIQTVAANTNANDFDFSKYNVSLTDKKNIDLNLTDKFQSFAQLLPNQGSHSSVFDQTLLSISHLQNYLRKIAVTPNSDMAAFAEAKNTFLNTTTTNPLQALFLEANNSPPPVQQWLNTLANSAWNLIQQQALGYLNKTWQTNILSFYNAKILDRYPLFKNASDDISPADFIKFFGPAGLLEEYTKNYLSPFIDMSNPDWKPKNVSGRTLALNPEFFNELERAGIIRTMFFTHDGKLVINFSIQAVTFETGVNNFNLKLNQTTISDSPGKTEVHFLSWPVVDSTEMAAFSFTNDKGEIFSEMKTGPWALFKLIENANLQPTQNTQSFGLTFDLDGNAARYQLFADKMINPFISGIIDQFRCPEVLSKNS